MILRRRLWSLTIIYLLLLGSSVWLGLSGLGWGTGPRTVALTVILVTAGGFVGLTESFFVRPLRARLRRLDDLVRTMDPSPHPPRVRGADDLETLRLDLHRVFHRFDETRGDLATRRIRAEVDSRTDPLTKLYNQRSFARSLMDEWERARRGRAPLSLLILDVDRFKSINDEFGHLLGNEALEKIAAIVREGIRPTDLAFRYAGDEFSVIMPRTGLGQAVVIADKIRQRANGQWIGDENDGRSLSLSVGAAEMNVEMRVPDDLVQMADRALYQSKEAGRNVVSYPVGRATFRVFRQEADDPRDPR